MVYKKAIISCTPLDGGHEGYEQAKKVRRLQRKDLDLLIQRVKHIYIIVCIPLRLTDKA